LTAASHALSTVTIKLFIVYSFSDGTEYGRRWLKSFDHTLYIISKLTPQENQ